MCALRPHLRQPFGTRLRAGQVVVKCGVVDGGHDCERVGVDLGRRRDLRLEAASVIARLRARYSQDQAVRSETLIGKRDRIAVEWHYLPSAGQAANADQISTALLARLALLAGSRPREMD